MIHDWDVSNHPHAIVVQLEMHARSMRGLRTLLGVRLSPCPTKEAKPEGLLRSRKRIFLGSGAPRLVLRWYWQDAASLDAWTRDVRYVHWWVDLVSNTPEASIRVETRRVRGAGPAMHAAADDRRRAPQHSAPALS